MKVGGRLIVQTGSIVTQSGDDTVEIQHGPFSFKLLFKGDKPAAGTPGVTAEGTNQALTLTFSTFNNALGTAWSSQVGTLQGKNLFLALYVHAVGEGTKICRLINYTFTLEGN